MSKFSILLTGGLGYIGSHACVALAEAGYDVVLVDNLVNANAAALDRLHRLCRTDIAFHQLDLRDRAALRALFDETPFDAVMHFAGLKSVSESVDQPIAYYDNNVCGTVSLLDEMKKHEVHRIVFSSSATIYGDPEHLPLTEDHPLRPRTPYGRTKLIIENLLADYAAANGEFRYVALRYFNPIGAHPSSLIGEDPRGIPNNLLPYIAQVAAGRLPRLRVFGDDYPTPDGTGMRDYVHVCDLARGHVAALTYLRDNQSSLTANLGTGRAYSVLEVVRTFERVSGRAVPLEIVRRRPGDIATCYADPSRAALKLQWDAMYDLAAMCRDAWGWQQANPGGYPRG